MLQDMWNAPPGFRPSKSAPSSPAKPLGMVPRTRSETFHVAHKVPIGDTPYVRAKNVQVNSFLPGFFLFFSFPCLLQQSTRFLPFWGFSMFQVLSVVPSLVLCVQLVNKDPERAIPLFWAAINAGDRVDSALKDMAIVMKQQNRAEEAIEAIKSLRSRCSDQAQESLDNILLDLYKVIGHFSLSKFHAILFIQKLILFLLLLY